MYLYVNVQLVFLFLFLCLAINKGGSRLPIHVITSGFDFLNIFWAWLLGLPAYFSLSPIICLFWKTDLLSSFVFRSM